MATKKTKIEIALERIEAEKRAREEAKRREKEQQDKLLMELGRVLVDTATKPTSEWASYRDRTVAELLAALGLDVVGETASDASRGEVERPTGDSDQSVGWSD
ncbi:MULTISPECIES: hypothetical protein [unclassified Corynebacterium]|uniref:hypothetical protein n=1 Tax=unclassified Corynebacterium TaxID=2624378 RepID=UPI0008A339F6|nr:MULTISPECIES: hypothetical protein [unclassified Corynebacterium]OFK66506.1 hypothetical protein HMPREF2807_09045 [Corynebacterium sp. HMSC074A09]OFP26481.1 hypothetical protein HMPREF2993_03490 [Corynebacterium sp. HMSC068G04]